MVKVYLSKKFPDAYFLQYSGSVGAKDDDLHDHLFKKFVKEHENMTFITEYVEGTHIIDQSFFYNSEIDNYDSEHHLKKMKSMNLHMMKISINT